LNILVLTFWSYKDALIQTYTLPYLKLMHKHLPADSQIYLLNLEKSHLKITPEENTKIDAELANYKITRIPFNYQSFGIQAICTWLLILVRLFFLIFQQNIQVIHSFCTPPGVAGWVLSILTGRKLIIDSYEPHAEASVENGDWKRNSFRFKFLLFLEKLQSRRAKTIISATKGMRKYALEKYGATFEHFYVKPACVNLELFSETNLKRQKLVEKFGFENKIVAVYAGKFGGIYLDKEVFDFLKIASDYWKDQFRVLILTNHKPHEISKFCQASQLDESLVQTAFVPHSEVPNHMGLADFALTPVKPIPTKRYCTPIKNGEYWALGLPIVSTANISDDSEIIEQEKIGAIIRAFNPTDYLRVVKEIDIILKKYNSKKRYQRIRRIAEQYRSFNIADKIYQEIYGK